LASITATPLPPDVHRDIEGLLRARLVELVRAGADVVVDFSFWSRAMREEYRELLRPLGVVPETVYLATDRAMSAGTADCLGRGGRRAPLGESGKTRLIMSGAGSDPQPSVPVLTNDLRSLYW
jgi:hypothetical protein